MKRLPPDRAGDLEEARVRHFDYDAIPAGYYDRILKTGRPIQRAWHRQKFSRAREELGAAGGRLLDIGCGPGSFLGSLSPENWEELVGIDIARPQVEYANQRYGGERRRFEVVEFAGRWPFPDHYFDAGSLLEVIEHLTGEQISVLASECLRVLKPGASLVMTTPNYASHWPVLEWLLGLMTPISYDEQHVTKFTRFNLRARLGKLLGERFAVEHVTTSHFLAPFLEALSPSLSDLVASVLTPRHWLWPFGALIVARVRILG